jgi:hypothetical protein
MKSSLNLDFSGDLAGGSHVASWNPVSFDPGDIGIYTCIVGPLPIPDLRAVSRPNPCSEIVGCQLKPP